ncbi:MAG: hypothetical protein A3C06_03160 [Candidatus Taylorbacteria bacterium RIFCSPHIGHO2_02_FULL_46_13]|uniref:Ribulose-phosphate 3-epimerase n=1 Tax=Candidatus Taylorbacteria bacterium RIFCSPHIGHO2_02_FULL_46_13 TaxID=1802312 RepID=A0A1G2MTK1_9BACT|nr:MAG: hypothetical protein A3C06_03160 [Candidatus Taylorbacteria bacterium RIFCSPHIGHO2_02_FULL_46_13]
MKTVIVPAVLPESFGELSEKLSEVVGHALWAQIDVCDGIFVPRVSWPYHPADVKKFGAIEREEEGLPHWEDFDFEIHLMVSDPVVQAPKWVRAGATRIISHVEATGDFSAVQSAVGGIVELGLALKLETSLDSVVPFADKISMLQLMSISKIGYQGSKFDSSAIEKVKEARERFPNLTISVDGGVNLENAKALLDAGANQLVVGSAIFAEEDPAFALGAFKKLAKEFDSR